MMDDYTEEEQEAKAHEETTRKGLLQSELRITGGQTKEPAELEDSAKLQSHKVPRRRYKAALLSHSRKRDPRLPLFLRWLVLELEALLSHNDWGGGNNSV